MLARAGLAFAAVAAFGFDTAIAAGEAAPQVPYVGVWDCQVAWFTFTNETYSPGGSSVMVVRSVAQEGDDFTLDIEGNYTLILSDVTDTTMTWRSLNSGDGLACTRLYR